MGQYATHKDTVAAVITDMAMPIMDGDATIRALRRMNPALNIIAASGQADSISQDRIRELGITESLAKPFTASQILRILFDLLHRAPGP